MYGIQPSKRWHSLSIFSPSSHHSEFLNTSRDTAYRNAVRVELAKAHTKTRSVLQSVIEVIEFADNNSALSIPPEVLRGEAKDTVKEMDRVLHRASSLDSEGLADAVRELRIARKALFGRLSQIRKEVIEGMCQVAPVNAVIMRSSWVDKFDAVAIWLAPVWLSLFGISALVLLFAIARSYKRD
jgi:hypothetical protein